MKTKRGYANLGALILVVLLIAAPSAEPTTIASVKVGDLLKQADLVAVVKILSGDTEHYPTAVYKAEVTKSFKGSTNGERVFFGPFIGYKVGYEYLAFLSRSEESIKPREGTPQGLSYGPVHPFYKIMYDGFSILPIDYACIFDGKEIREKCDYGVKLNISQVVLPKNIKTFPIEKDDADSGDDKWVRRDGFLSFLEGLSKPI